MAVPFLIFVPFILCITAILTLLNYRRRQLRPNANLYRDALNDEQEEVQREEDWEPENDNDPGEGSSTATPTRRKIGKKRGERLQRKEQMRQYREYLVQQQEIQRAQNEILEFESQRTRAAEAIQREEEAEKRRKARERKAKQEEKERIEQKKTLEREAKRRKARFEKYSGKIKDTVKRLKWCTMDELSRETGIDIEEATDILCQLYEKDQDLGLSLWSSDNTAFLFVVKEDYDHLSEYVHKKGKAVIKEAAEKDGISLLRD